MLALALAAAPPSGEVLRTACELLLLWQHAGGAGNDSALVDTAVDVDEKTGELQVCLPHSALPACCGVDVLPNSSSASLWQTPSGNMN